MKFTQELTDQEYRGLTTQQQGDYREWLLAQHRTGEEEYGYYSDRTMDRRRWREDSLDEMQERAERGECAELAAPLPTGDISGMRERDYQQAVERATAGLTNRQAVIWAAYGECATVQGAARATGYNWHTIRRELTKIERAIRTEASAYAGWYLCYLEDISRKRHFFEANIG